MASVGLWMDVAALHPESVSSADAAPCAQNQGSSGPEAVAAPIKAPLNAAAQHAISTVVNQPHGPAVNAPVASAAHPTTAQPGVAISSATAVHSPAQPVQATAVQVPSGPGASAHVVTAAHAPAAAQPAPLSQPVATVSAATPAAPSVASVASAHGMPVATPVAAPAAVTAPAAPAAVTAPAAPSPAAPTPAAQPMSTAPAPAVVQPMTAAHAPAAPVTAAPVSSIPALPAVQPASIPAAAAQAGVSVAAAAPTPAPPTPGMTAPSATPATIATPATPATIATPATPATQLTPSPAAHAAPVPPSAPSAAAITAPHTTPAPAPSHTLPPPSAPAAPAQPVHAAAPTAPAATAQPAIAASAAPAPAATAAQPTLSTPHPSAAPVAQPASAHAAAPVQPAATPGAAAATQGGPAQAAIAAEHLGNSSANTKAPMSAASKNIISGTFGGVSLVAIGHPFDTVKVKMQCQSLLMGPGQQPLYNSPMDCARQTIKSEGSAGLYKGVASPLVGQMVFNAMLFTTFDEIRRTMLKHNGGLPLTPLQVATAGGCAGACVTLVETPIDLFKSKMQLQSLEQEAAAKAGRRIEGGYSGLSDCVKKIYQQNGIRGCYQGGMATLCRNSIVNFWFFGMYDGLRRVFTKSNGDCSTVALAASGCTAGAISTVASYPFDVVKSAMMSDGTNPATRRYRGMLDCARSLYKEGGHSAFVKGLTPSLMRAMPGNAVLIVVVETTRKMLS